MDELDGYADVEPPEGRCAANEDNPARFATAVLSLDVNVPTRPAHG
jgi:hypothetical protein